MRHLALVLLATLLPLTAGAQTTTSAAPTSLLPPAQPASSSAIQSEPLPPPSDLSAPPLAAPSGPGPVPAGTAPPATQATPPMPPSPTLPQTSGAETPTQQLQGAAAPAQAPGEGVASPTTGATGSAQMPGASTAQTTPGQPSQTAPVVPKPNPWLARGGAVLQVLDKPDAESKVLTVPVGQSVTYGSLTITVKACLVRPPDMPPNATAFLDITDQHADQPPFSGWMVAADPWLSMLQNPVYDVRVKSCTS